MGLLLIFSGGFAPSLSALTASASVSYVNPVYSGTGTPSLSALTAAPTAPTFRRNLYDRAGSRGVQT